MALLVFLAWAGAVSTVEITLGGDVMLARNGEPVVESAAAFGDALPALRQADLAMANLESPVAYEPPILSGEYNLCAAAVSIGILYNAGLDVATIANNHAHDCSPTGDLETQKWLQEQGIIGVGGSEPFRIVEVKGQKIAIFAYEDITKTIDIEKMLREVSDARKSVDFLIVSLHWGMEYQAGPTARQRVIAQKLADAGVDVIWGHHPHVLQRMEWLENRDATHKTLVIYSLGNLISDQSMLQDTQETALVTLAVRNGALSDVAISPLTADRFAHQLHAAQGTDQASIFERLKWNAELP